MLHAVSVLQLFDLINPDQPVLRRERFLQVLQLYVFVANLSVACPIKAWRCPEVQLHRNHNAQIKLVPFSKYSVNLTVTDGFI